MHTDFLFNFLEKKYEQYNTSSFIELDPISIPHQFSKKEDVEISGFLTSIISWGNRTSILKNGNHLFRLMDNSPHEFLLHHTKNDLSRFEKFTHRTLNGIDSKFFISSLKNIYQNHGGLEKAFSKNLRASSGNIEAAILGFRKIFFDIPHQKRTEKHLASPGNNSACKRTNMFLRWMVRKDKNGIDFGIWNSISPSQLICPLDVHSARTARKLSLLTREQEDWKAALELADNLKKFDPKDPAKYDFALFGLGVYEKF